METSIHTQTGMILARMVSDGGRRGKRMRIQTAPDTPPANEQGQTSSASLAACDKRKHITGGAFCRISEECTVVDEPARGGRWT